MENKGTMFKLQINWLREGKWEDTVYKVPCPYVFQLKRYQELSRLFPEHEYRILSMMDVK